MDPIFLDLSWTLPRPRSKSTPVGWWMDRRFLPNYFGGVVCRMQYRHVPFAGLSLSHLPAHYIFQNRSMYNSYSEYTVELVLVLVLLVLVMEVLVLVLLGTGTMTRSSTTTTTTTTATKRATPRRTAATTERQRQQPTTVRQQQQPTIRATPTSSQRSEQHQRTEQH